MQVTCSNPRVLDRATNSGEAAVRHAEFVRCRNNGGPSRPIRCCHRDGSCPLGFQCQFRLVLGVDELRVIEGISADNIQDRCEGPRGIGRADMAIDRAFQESATGFALGALTIQVMRGDAVGLQLIQHVGEEPRSNVAR